MGCMEILYIYKWASAGGVERVLLNRALAFKAAGANIRLNCLFLEDLGGATLMTRYIHDHALGDYCRVISKLDEVEPDLVVALDTPEAFALADFRAPRLIECHTAYTENRAYLGEPDLVEQVDALWVPSAHFASIIEAEYPQWSDKIDVVGDFVALDDTEPEFDATTVLQGVPIVYLGRVDILKNVREAVRIVKLAREISGLDLHFHIIGSLHDLTFREYIHEEGVVLYTHVHATVGFNQTWPILRQAAQAGGALLSASRGESFGLATAEAMLLGLPVLLSDIDAHRDLTRGAEKQLFILGDEDAAAHRLVNLLEPSAWRDAALRGRLNISRHDARQFIADWRQALRRVGLAFECPHEASLLAIAHPREHNDEIREGVIALLHERDTYSARADALMVELDPLKHARTHAETERDAARASLDQALADLRATRALLADITASWSWKITAPARFLPRLMRHGLLASDRKWFEDQARRVFHRLPLSQQLKDKLYHLYGRLLGYPAPPDLPPGTGATDVGMTTYLAPEGWDRTHQKYAVICLPIIDWNFRFQRPQQLARCFARDGHPVYYAGLGFAEALNLRDIEPGVVGITFSGRADTNVYKEMPRQEDVERLASELLGMIQAAGHEQWVCVAQLPYWGPIAEKLREIGGCRVIYDCMDDHAGFSTNGPEMLAAEERLLAQADLVIASSQVLMDKVMPLARRATLIRNAGDYPHFASVPDTPHQPTEALCVGYYGAIADWFDSDLVGALARSRPNWRLVLIGSTFSADTAPLVACANIELPGEKPYGELPALIADWDCCLIPFKRVPLTEATNPVKVYEMLAAGKPVVAVPLPELRPIAELGHIALAETAEDFARAIEAEVAADDARRRAGRRAYAADNTWEVRRHALDAAIRDLFPLVSVIVVTYNNLALNRLCLESLLKDTAYPNIEVIVVDNASTDGTVDYLADIAHDTPRLRLILNQENRGFAAANNQGLAVARGEYLCLLNNDTVVSGSWLSTLVGHAQRDMDLGIVGPVTNAIGNEAKIPVGYQHLADMPHWAEDYCRKNKGRLDDISMLAFFCVVMRREVFERIGPLDERFGIGMFEDDDYNHRVRVAGYTVKLAHDSFVHHWQRASFKLLGEDEYLRIFYENKGRYRAKLAQAKLGSDEQAAMDALVEACAAAPGIVLFPPSIGWNVHLFQRPHHLARAFAARGFRVIFDCSNSNVDQVEFLREVEPGIHLFKGEPSVFSNLAGLILWTFTYNYDYVDHFPAATQVVYDWIDDLAVFPYDQAWLKQMHERAVRESDVVASVARRLHEDLRAQRPDAVYLPNAVDAAHFRTPPEPNPARLDADLADFVGSGAPVAGYYGALAEWFDYHLLAEVARLKPEWRFILVGPDYDQSLGRSRVTALENVRWIGPRDYAHLPGYLHLFDVAMIPFKINDITIATSPLKLFEYFAGGRPVVTTPMPECMAFSEVLIGATPADFAEHLDRALVSGKDEGKSVALRILGEQNTWDQRVEAVATALAKARQSGASQYGVAKQFKSLERADNRHFFRALARHFTNLAADPRLPGLLEYALTTNQRGRELCALVGKHVALAGKRYIDIDSAYGGTLVAFGEKGAKPMGIEADSQLIELAGQNFKDVGQAYPVYKRDFRRAEDLTEFQGQFDLITCQRAVVTIEDPRQAIGRVVDMLAPGGVAYIELPNYEAIDAVRADPKYGLFGATLLDATSVRAYLAAKSLPVSAEQTVYPTRAELMAWVAQAGLPSEVLTDTPPWFGWAGLAEQAAGLAHDGAAAIAQVPEEVRALVATALENYLSRLNGVINDTKRDPAALFAWGAPFLRVLIKKPSTSSVPQSQAPGVAANDGRPAYFQGWRHTKGRCNICGHDTRFFYQDPALYRESLTCEHCRSTSRYRSIARGVLRALKDIAGVEAPSLAALPTTGVGHKVRIYDTQVPFAYEVCAYPLGKYLRACDWIELNLSMYKPDKPLGARLAEGIGNQNLEALTFADASMDIVITSDVMEHVRVDDAAHREIARVLAPGGAYVFTVPHIMALAETRQLVRIHDPRDASKDEFLCEPEYHGDANSDDGKGVLAYRCYGGDLRDILESKGFAWDYTFEAYPEIGIENTELFYCRRQPLTAHKVESKQDVLGAQRIDDEGASVEPIEVETVTSRFKAMRNPSNRFFFDALSRHLAGLVDDPCLPMYFSFALTANERGEKVANLLGQRMEIRGKRHLDVGCAFGGFLVAFHEQGASTCGFDIDASLLSLARANFRDESVEHALYLKDVTKAEDVAEFKACFDIVTCNDVIEHVADPAAAFANIAAMLSANGVAYFEIPNRDAAAFVLADGHYQLFGISQLDRDDARAYYAAHAPGVPYGVEHYYRLAQYRNLLDQCGMDMEILEESLEGVTRENTEQALRTIDASLRQEMKKVPNTVADQVDAAVRDYLHRAKDSSQDSCMKEREFLLTYGAGFWKILARKR